MVLTDPSPVVQAHGSVSSRIPVTARLVTPASWTLEKVGNFSMWCASGRPWRTKGRTASVLASPGLWIVPLLVPSSPPPCWHPRALPKAAAHLAMLRGGQAPDLALVSASLRAVNHASFCQLSGVVGFLCSVVGEPPWGGPGLSPLSLVTSSGCQGEQGKDVGD